MSYNDYNDYEYESGGIGTGGLVALIIAAVAIKISIIACICYYCRRRSYGYIAAPNNTATVAVVQSNQTSYPYVQQQMPTMQPQYPAYPAHAATVPHTQGPPAYTSNVAQPGQFPQGQA